MRTLTAILHTDNDALRIARAVESLRPCDEVLVIDHSSSDDTCLIARAFGARVIAASENSLQDYLPEARHDWIFFLLPTESLSEGLEASLHEWKLGEGKADTAAGQVVYAAEVSEETAMGWITHPPEVRLAHRLHARWDGKRPVAEDVLSVLPGHLLRLRLP